VRACVPRYTDSSTWHGTQFQGYYISTHCNVSPTNKLTTWSRVLEKLMVTLLVKKFPPAFYEACRFITVLTKCCHSGISWARCIQSTSSYSYFPKIHSNVILPFTPSRSSTWSLPFRLQFVVNFILSMFLNHILSASYVCLNICVYVLWYKTRTSVLTNSMEQNPSWEADSHLADQFLAFNGTKKFIIMFARARHWSLQSTTFRPFPYDYLPICA